MVLVIAETSEDYVQYCRAKKLDHVHTLWVTSRGRANSQAKRIRTVDPTPIKVIDTIEKVTYTA